MKRREALEAYRKARAGLAAEKSAEPVVSTSPAVSVPVERSRPARLPANNPSVYAAQRYEKWIAEGCVAELLEHYAFLPLPTQRQKVLLWAVEKAAEGNFHPLLSIGIDDLEPLLRKHVNRQLDNIPTELLLSKLAEERYTIRERRSVAGLLGRCKDPQAGRLLAKLAENEDAQVRESALQALAHFPPTEGLQLPIFTRRLEGDPHPDVQLRAAEGLARLGSPQAITALTKATRKDDARPEIQAVLAGWQARQRPQGEYESGGMAAVGAERKPFPKDLVPKLCAILILFGIAGYRLSEPVKRWYDKKFPQVEQTAAAPGT